MKKILIICIPNDSSGVPIYTKHLIDTFHNKSELFIITSGNGGIFKEDIAKQKIKRIEIGQLENTTSPISLAKYCINYYKVISSNKFDLIHTQGAMFGVIGRLVTNKRSKVLHTYHGLPFEAGVPLFRRLCLIILEKIILTITKHASIVLSKKNKKTLKRLSSRSQIEVIYNFSRFSPAKCVGKKEFDLISVAGFRLQKNHKLLFKIFNSLPTGTKLLCLGPGIDSYEAMQMIESLVEKPKRQHITMLGPRKKLDVFFLKSKAFIQTSHYEGLSLAAIEARAYGLKLFLTDTSGTEELLEGWDGLVINENENENEIALRIRKSLNDYFDASSINDRIPQRFRVKTFNDQMRKYYE